MIKINDKTKIILEKINKNNCFFIMDFDRTITCGNSQTSWGVMADKDTIPLKFREEKEKLYDHYRPLEVDADIDEETKKDLMIDWFYESLSLFEKYHVSKKTIEEITKNPNTMKMRNGMDGLFKFCKENNIPIIIISAGITDFIKGFLISNNYSLDNIIIKSNEFIFSNDKVAGFKNIVHSYNKNEIKLTEQEQNLITGKENLILMGDLISDIQMSNNFVYKNIVNIGFLNDETNEHIDEYVENFDIVVFNQESVEKIGKTIFQTYK